MGSGDKSRRAKLEAAQRQLNIEIPELDSGVELPESMYLVWSYFVDLHNSRSLAGFGVVNPLSYSDIKSYFDLLNIYPMEWEIRVIKRLDSIALKIHSEEQEKQQKTKKSK